MAKKKKPKKTEVQRLIRAANRIGMQEDAGAELEHKYLVLQANKKKELEHKGIKGLRKLVPRNSITALKECEGGCMGVFQSVSNAWNNLSGLIWVACFCSLLKKRGIPYKLEVERFGVSISKIDVVIWPERSYEIYVELKRSARERKDQIAKAYEKYVGNRAFFITHGRDLYQSSGVDRLAESNVKSVVIENKDDRLTGVYSVQDVIDLALSHKRKLRQVA